MRSQHLIVPAAVALFAATFSSGAQAQGFRVGDILIPDSSIEYREDIGVRAHTNLQIFVGPGRGVGYDGGLGPGGGMTPAQLRAAYSLPATGGSQIVAIVDAYDDPNALSDFNSFSSYFGLPTETSTNVTASTNKVFQVVYENGAEPSADSTGGWEIEESLDIEWAHAMAPNAKIILVEAASANFTDLLTAEATATSYTDGNGLKVKEISNSWSSSEFSGEDSYDSSFSSTNVVYFASAGDYGAPAGYPSASPYVVSAGGTTVNTDTNGNFTSETGWILSNGSGGGGGPSAYESIPSFQNGIASIVGSWRGTPDISYDANPSTGASVYDSYPYEGTSYTWWMVGGTSLASPALAGIANLAATAEGSFPAGSQALLATIYSNLGSANFRDITVGNNGYPAMVGWDFVTGVGSCIGLGGLQSAPAAPSLSSLSPSSAIAGAAAFTLTVNGAHFLTGATIYWNGAALSTTFVSSTQVTASVPAADIATVGTANITAANPGSAASNALAFTINNPAPSLSSLSPNSATAGSAAFTLTVNGSGFMSGATVNWNGAALTTTFVSSSQVTVSVPAADIASAGTANITAANPSSSASNALTFTVQAAGPSLTSLSPSSATVGGAAFKLTLSGSGFVKGATVNWNGTALTTTFVAATKVTASVPAADLASAGTASVTATNPGTAPSNALTFTINNPVPSLSSLSPSSAIAGGAAFTLTVNGAHFASGATVYWNGAALTTTYVLAGKVTASVPAADIASAGTANVTVTNPGSAASKSLKFTIDNPKPVLTSLSPNSTTHGSGSLTITLTGSNFIPGSEVKWIFGGKTTVLTSNFVSSTTLTATVTSALLVKAGKATVEVTSPTPGGGTSAGETFTLQ